MSSLINISTHEYSQDQLEVLKAIGIYFESLENCDELKFTSIWYPQAARFTLGNSNEIYRFDKDQIIKYTIKGLRQAKKSNPKFYVNNKVERISHIKVIDVVASVELQWKMEMPENTGIHSSFFHLAKDDNCWRIIGLLDRGIEA